MAASHTACTVCRTGVHIERCVHFHSLHIVHSTRNTASQSHQHVHPPPNHPTRPLHHEKPRTKHGRVQCPKASPFLPLVLVALWLPQSVSSGRSLNHTCICRHVNNSHAVYIYAVLICGVHHGRCWNHVNCCSALHQSRRPNRIRLVENPSSCRDCLV